MKRMKVMTIVGTRPEIIKLSRVMAELDRSVDHVLVHTGQNYDRQLNDIFFEEMGVRPPRHVLGVAGATVAETIANVIVRVDQVLESEKPDAVLLYGDTNSCLAVIPAKRRKIPVFHMEAGNRSFDERVPEEINRRLVDHLSDINMPLTEHSRRYLLDEGLPADRVIKTGSTMHEVLSFYREKIDGSQALTKLDLEKGKYFVVSIHREENVDVPERLTKLLDTLEAVVQQWGFPIIVSTHPRTFKRLEALGPRGMDSRIRFLQPMGFFDYVKLQMSSFCVLSDSGTITEESSLLGFPAVTLREAHERPEGMDVGTLVMSGLGRDRALEAIRVVTDQVERLGRPSRPVVDYVAEKVSVQVVRIILSYTDFVNRTVWRKQVE